LLKERSRDKGDKAVLPGRCGGFSLLTCSLPAMPSELKCLGFTRDDPSLPLP